MDPRTALAAGSRPHTTLAVGGDQRVRLVEAALFRVDADEANGVRAGHTGGAGASSIEPPIRWPAYRGGPSVAAPAAAGAAGVAAERARAAPVPACNFLGRSGD